MRRGRVGGIPDGYFFPLSNFFPLSPAIPPPVDFYKNFLHPPHSYAVNLLAKIVVPVNTMTETFL